MPIVLQTISTEVPLELPIRKKITTEVTLPPAKVEMERIREKHSTVTNAKETPQTYKTVNIHPLYSTIQKRVK
jgi:hypothetical protein